MLSIFGLKISGAHYNPAVSVAFMIKRDVGSFPRILGFAYIFVQIIGAFFGALVAWFLLNDGAIMQSQGNITVQGWPDSTGSLSYGKSTFAAIIAEALGTFFVAFFYLLQTEDKTVFSKEKAINCFIIASAYIGARGMLSGNTFTVSGAVLNPAIAIGTTLTQLFATNVSGFKYVWLYGLMPFIGSVAAQLFYDYVFKKTHEVLEDSNGNESDDDTLLENK